MLMDALNEVSSAQVVTATANSTNVLDCLAPRNLGSGKPLYPTLNISAITGTNPTLVATLIGADNAALSTNPITVLTVSLTAAQLAAIKALVSTGPGVVGGALNIHCGVVPSHTPKRFFGWTYTTGGTTPSMTITADFVQDEQTNPPPPLT